MNENPQIKNLVVGLIVVTAIGAIFVVGVSYAIKSIILEPNTEETIKTVVLKAPECKGGFEEYKNLADKGQIIKLTENQRTFALNGQLTGEKRVIARRGGEIACGYIYMEAQKGSNKLDPKYDSIYVNPQSLGGHIIRSRSLEIPNKNDNISAVLLNLKSVPFLPKIPYNPNAQNFEVADWVKLLNASSKTEFIIGLSTTDQQGFINEVSIAYKCWNPETGEETQDCQLGIE